MSFSSPSPSGLPGILPPDLSPWPQCLFFSNTCHSPDEQLLAALPHSQDKVQMRGTGILCLRRSLLGHLPWDSLTLCAPTKSHDSFLPKTSPAFSHLFCFCSSLSKTRNTCPRLWILLLFQDQLKCQLCSERSLMPSQPPLSHMACVVHDRIVHCIETLTYTDVLPTCLYKPQRRGLW